MSHSVIIRTQTVTTNSSAIVINTGYIKTWSGILKFLQLVRIEIFFLLQKKKNK